MSHTNGANAANRQRDTIANSLILLLKKLDPQLDISHFAKHELPRRGDIDQGQLTGNLTGSHTRIPAPPPSPSTRYICGQESLPTGEECAVGGQEFNVNPTTPEAREEAQWALAGSAASMHGQPRGRDWVSGVTAFALADFILERLDLEGKAYSSSAYEELQGRQGVQRV
ncbi:hypothetical protein BU25DRAFT_492415 [Macroventuria anomochaeta]|uniref:Uncharacterized protein n=1 Tax=Macroventuria anomochaeta TaxID=301207 RepID=A0ACB6RVU8_9PLEO|nr:uncharacterized protein BU25DRAFT_492415 [Macroventuria anomochaeta]KAF2625858.1 hypothetical protein BU25DRAFT_492415 [Macroventuria anomochaeta]